MEMVAHAEVFAKKVVMIAVAENPSIEVKSVSFALIASSKH